MDYHVFKKSKIKNGKKIYKWRFVYVENCFFSSGTDAAGIKQQRRFGVASLKVYTDVHF